MTSIKPFPHHLFPPSHRTVSESSLIPVLFSLSQMVVSVTFSDHSFCLHPATGSRHHCIAMQELDAYQLMMIWKHVAEYLESRDM